MNANEFKMSYETIERLQIHKRPEPSQFFGMTKNEQTKPSASLSKIWTMTLFFKSSTLWSHTFNISEAIATGRV